MQQNFDDIVIFLAVTSLLIAVLVGFIGFILVLYKKKQILFKRNLEQIIVDHEKTLLHAQLEIQENTFEHISKEIHDNINLSLTLAKLNLNTINTNDPKQLMLKIDNSIELLSKSIFELSNISKALNADLIIQQGLPKAIGDEINRISRASNFEIHYLLTGNPVYLNSQQELIIFRIIQEAFNNIIKHSEATSANLILNYDEYQLSIVISDNGKGFDQDCMAIQGTAGLKNMESRTKMLGGTMIINSENEIGTRLNFEFPFKNFVNSNK